MEIDLVARIRKHDKSRRFIKLGERLEDLRSYLADYQGSGKVARITVDNVRRVLSTFFSWLEDEDYILKSPVRRIKKIRSVQVVKETYSDEALEMMRDSCSNIRDLAIVDLLASTGIRVGELVHMNRGDIDFENRVCIVFGEESKERKVYFDARTKLHLSSYLDGRDDENPAMFVAHNAPHDRLQISGVETMLHKLGQSISLGKVHPHKFRRTLATRALCVRNNCTPHPQPVRMNGQASRLHPCTRTA